MAGLLKVMCMLPRQRAPPNLHFQKLNPHCDLEDFPNQHPGGGAAGACLGCRPCVVWPFLFWIWRTGCLGIFGCLHQPKPL